MVKFEPLTSEEAKRIEQEALEKYYRATSEGKKPKLAEGELAHIKSIFPFHLFPDELIIRPETVTYIIRWGPGMHQSTTIHFDDIAQVAADVGPFLGQLRIIPKLRTEEPLIIEKISRKNALALEKLIEGMIEAHHKKHASTY
ncbi:MAG TPA: hypothetical protein VIH52_01625 [Candidatus Nanoarchaeia archaeon]